jgi:predicted RNA polymerase sigma factor
VLTLNQSQLVAKLIKPLAELDTSEASPQQVVMAALTWPTDGWASQALDWLEQGVEIDIEIATALESFAAHKHYSQASRHKAFALAKRWRRNNEPRT